MQITDIIDKPLPFDFYGVYNNCFKLGDTVFEAIEDPYDGYRSYLDTITLTSRVGVFSRRPFAQVYVQSYEDGIALIDTSTRHVWLKVYTDSSDNYYPYFCFIYDIPGTLVEFDPTGACPKEIYPELFV